MSPVPHPAPGVPLHLVVMGVSGTGKSTIAHGLEERLGWAFAEGDEFHPAANVSKMASGLPLDDEDRWPWLRSLRDWTAERDARGEPTVVTCSALKHAYRDLLREGGPGTYFVHLVGERDLLLERMGSREHFMPPSLLDSQLDTLEPLGDHERGVRVDVASTKERIVETVVEQLGLDRPATGGAGR